MKRILFAPCLLLLLSSVVTASEVVVKESFDDQPVGQQLDGLQNWKFFGGWVKPEFGQIVSEGNNRFLRMKGDIFVRHQVILEDKLTYRFKARAAGDTEEVGGLALRSSDGKTRYDILLGYKHGNISLTADHAGARAELATGTGLKNNVFQEIVVTVEKESAGVKFSVSVDGANVFEKEDSQDAGIFSESFTAGFFTYNSKMIDFDAVEFTRGK